MVLLRTTDLPVSEIAHEAGFSSPQAFSRAFRSSTSITPLNYRNSTEEG
jgi:transcriptional regulator GlxA family with amidase domain